MKKIEVVNTCSNWQVSVNVDLKQQQQVHQ